MIQIQPVSKDDLYRDKVEKPFNMIDNYVYLYHTNTLIVLPVYPDSIADSTAVSYSANHPMLRSAPIFSYSSSGPRSLTIELPLHRDIMHDVNVETTTMFSSRIDELANEDYVDILINQLQSMAVPRYGAAEKMVDPPLVAIRFGDSIFCKGVVDQGVTTLHSGPILTNNKYALVTVSFTIHEVDPYDAESVALVGGYRGIRTTLDSNVYQAQSTGVNPSRGIFGGGSRTKLATTMLM